MFLRQARIRLEEATVAGLVPGGSNPHSDSIHKRPGPAPGPGPVA